MFKNVWSYFNAHIFSKKIQYVGVLTLFLMVWQGCSAQGKWVFDLKKGQIGYVNTNPTPSKDRRLKDAPKAIEEILTEFKVPGASVVVVEKDKVLMASGFGYRDLATKTAANDSTLFLIGSCTKAFTTALMGTLMDEKKLDFDKPVNSYWPELRFKDPLLTQQVTLRDMMTHRTGLPRHDLAWYLRGTSTDRAELLKCIANFDASAGLREYWQYNNFMYMAQGALAEHLTGNTWEQLVKERILAPLGMRHAVLTSSELRRSNNRSTGYLYREKESLIQAMDYYTFSGMEPAGSIAASAQDMSKWLQLWVRGGDIQGKSLFSSSFYQQAIKVQMAMPPGGNRPELNTYMMGYGLGWMIRSYKGHYFVEHGGNIDGFSATTGFFPNDSVAIYVCVNQNGSAAAAAIRNWLADRMLEETPTDWIKTLKSSPVEADGADLSQIAGTTPSHAVDEYTGTYQHSGYGDIVIFSKNGGLMARLGQDTVQVAHVHYDIFKFTGERLAEIGESNGMKFRFNTGYDGHISSLDAKLEPALERELIFTKKIEVQPSNTSVDFNLYIGNYNLSGTKVKVFERNKTLYISIPGQPDYELLPYKPDEFKLTVAEGYFIRFEQQGGKVVAAYSVQPNGTFKMERE
jgi:CubicO group peptidase (beta-lactamase class C family)